MGQLEMRMGDWELDETDPLSPAYKTNFERGFDKLVETFHYIYDLYFGDNPNVKREDYGLI